MKPIEKMTKKELISEYRIMYGLINDISCYGLRDIRYFEALEEEIDKRGYEIHQSVEVR